MLQAGADVHAQDSAGITPLYWAATDRIGEPPRLLLQHGSDTHVKNKKGKTLLDLWPDLAEIVKEMEAEKAKRPNIDPPQSPAAPGQPAEKKGSRIGQVAGI